MNNSKHLVQRKVQIKCIIGTNQQINILNLAFLEELFITTGSSIQCDSFSLCCRAFL